MSLEGLIPTYFASVRFNSVSDSKGSEVYFNKSQKYLYKINCYEKKRLTKRIEKNEIEKNSENRKRI